MSRSTSQIECVGVSDIGLTRDHNEDVWAAFPERGLFLLADGMGGHAAGEVAADETVSYLNELVRKWHPTKHTTPDEAVTFFREALAKVNVRIYEKGQSETSLSGMGTTICACFFLGGHAVISHVGDSRVYLLRDQQLQQLTEDHSLISELVSIGAMKSDESAAFPYKHILTRAIGTHPTVEPTVNYLTSLPGDCFLICSDGLTNFASDPEIEEILSRELPLAKQAQALIDLANEHGGGDNITVVLIKVQDDLSR